MLTWPGQKVKSNNINYTRSQHLDSYLKDETLGRSTVKVSADDTTYDTVFATVSEYTLVLRVHFPAAALGDGVTPKPIMQLRGVVATHPWLDDKGNVKGFDPISTERAFRESKLLLGQAVNQVVRRLQVDPPNILEITDPGLRAKNPGKKLDPQQSKNADLPPSYETLLNRSTPQVNLPNIPTKFPDLDVLDREKLEELLNNDVAFLDHCNKLPYSLELQQLVSVKYQELATLATENLSRQRELQELYDSAKTKHEKLKMVVEEFKVLEKRQDLLQGKPDVAVLIKELRKEKQMALDESDKLAEAWLKGGRCKDTMEDFCRDFLETRNLYYLRAAKEQLLNQQKNSHPMV